MRERAEQRVTKRSSVFESGVSGKDAEFVKTKVACMLLPLMVSQRYRILQRVKVAHHHDHQQFLNAL